MEQISHLAEEPSTQRFYLTLCACEGFINFCLESPSAVPPASDPEIESFRFVYAIREYAYKVWRETFPFEQPLLGQAKNQKAVEVFTDEKLFALYVRSLSLETVNTALQNRFIENSSLDFIILKDQIAQAVAVKRDLG